MEFLRPAMAASSMSARQSRQFARRFHTSFVRSATPLPIPVISSSPPQPPQKAVSQPEDRVERKKRQAELLNRGAALRADPTKPSTALQKRFWKEVSVKTTDNGLQVALDSRPVRTSGRQVLSIPHSKRALATAIALEWDQLVSAQQALKQHYIPLTSLASRAVDLEQADSQSNAKTREEIVRMMMRYLATDTLLCWNPEKNIHDPNGMSGTTQGGDTPRSLRAQQIAVAQPIIGFLTTHIFPGVEIHPVLAEESIMPIPQPQMTQEVIRGWLHGLPAYELAALERAMLASKSLLVAIRLLVEWSQEFRHLQPRNQEVERFGIQQAAEACSVEVTWQTNMWGEVEDTHDVEKEDLARQLGSVILLVS